MRCIVSVATGPHYITNQIRMARSLPVGTATSLWVDQLPPGSPTHTDNPYAFKIFAIEEVAIRGATSILWLDSSAIILKPLNPIWDLIEAQGYWFSRNYQWNNGQFCSDEALAIMKTNRDAAFKVPHCVASCFGLDMSAPIGRVFLAAWKNWAEMGAFKGDRGNLAGGDPHTYQGHRNDQAVASQIIADLGMTMTDPPDYFAEQGCPQSDATILTLER